MITTEEAIYRILKDKKLSLGVVESATGGLVTHRLTNMPGISGVYKGGINAYANETKINVVGVSAATLKDYGAVSSQTAEEMALGGKRVLDVDICISDTGIAGPGGATPEKPVGLFYFGLAYNHEVSSRRKIFTGGRQEIKAAAADTLLAWLLEYLEGID